MLLVGDYEEVREKVEENRSVDRDAISEGSLQRRLDEELSALLGKDDGGLSEKTVGRLKEDWSQEHARWSKRDLSAKRYVYFWADGIYVQARLEDKAQ